MIYLYECTKCNTEQEKEHKMAENNKEPCERCSAPASKLKRLINVTAKGGHSSWRVV